MCRATFEFVPNERSMVKHRSFSVGRDHPTWACIELTSLCNYNCKYCFTRNPSSKHDMRLSDIVRLLESLAENGFVQVSIIGGEPTLSPCFLPALEYAARVGLIVHICTNGSTMDCAMAKRLKSCGVDQVQVNLEHINITKHREIRGIVDCNTVTPVKALDVCRDQGMNTVMAVVADEDNIESIPYLMKLAKDQGYSGFRVWRRVVPISGSLRLAYDDMFRQVVLKLVESAGSLDVKRISSTSSNLDGLVSKNAQLGGCPAGRQSVCFSSSGKVMPCSFVREDLGNIKEESLETILKRYMSSSRLSKGDLCLS